MPGVRSRLTSGRAVAVTLDACGGPGGNGYDAALIATLRRHRVPATLFLNLRWIEGHRSLAAELADDGLFEVANHGVRHLPLSTTGRAAYGIPGTRSLSAALDEVLASTAWFERHTGAPPQWFRPGTAHLDDVTARACVLLGQPAVGFSVNADFGATAAPATVAANLRGVRKRDIVISHLNHPEGGTAEGYAAALPRLLDRGVRFTRLDGALA